VVTLTLDEAGDSPEYLQYVHRITRRDAFYALWSNLVEHENRIQQNRAEADKMRE
jgi:hypothetical protein